MRCYSKMCSKADMSQLNLPHRTNKWKTKKKQKRKKNDKLRSIGKRFGESMKSVLKKKTKATVGRICRTGSF